VGWIIFRDKAHLPKDLIFELHYLGSVEYSFSLNFSRPAAPIIVQYFSLIHLGFEGYRSIALDDLKNARLLSRALENSGYYTVLSDIHRMVEGEAVDERWMSAKEYDEEDVAVSSLFVLVSARFIASFTIQSYVPGLPVVAFRFSDDFQKNHPEVQQKWIQTLLRSKGW
jgi:glutamate decarboxylase